VAELLGQAIEQSGQIGGGCDQEAFVLSVHGTRLKLVAARFSAAYLSYVRSEKMPVEEYLWVRRSEPYDLKTHLGRVVGLKICIGIINYILSGKAEIGLMQTIFERVKY
jgi:hypothetical protein